MLSRVNNSQELGRINPDTGLQQNVGPSLVRSLMFSMHHHFWFGSVQATFVRATASETLNGQDVPEAPRLIRDVWIHRCSECKAARCRARPEHEIYGSVDD